MSDSASMKADAYCPDFSWQLKERQHHSILNGAIQNINDGYTLLNEDVKELERMNRRWKDRINVGERCANFFKRLNTRLYRLARKDDELRVFSGSSNTNSGKSHSSNNSNKTIHKSKHSGSVKNLLHNFQ